MNAKILYVRNEHNIPTAAIAYVPQTETAAAVLDAASKNGGFLAKVAGAWCHPKDNFVKAVARAKAIGRLDSKYQQATVWIPVDGIDSVVGSGVWWAAVERHIVDFATEALKGDSN